jgi:YD repeat-containing protein
MSVFFQRGRRQAVLARASFAALLTVLTPALVTAQNPFGDTGFSGQRGTFSALPYEHVDPLSGNLIVTVTDLALPGNAGLDLRVARTYNSKFHRDFEHGNTAVDEPSAVGVGWRLHFGRVLHLESNQPGQTVIETPDGGGQPLYQTSAFPEGWMSKGFVRYNRTTHTAKFPNGLVYTFGHVAESSGPRGTVRSVTAITDPFGNSLTFTYHTGPIPGAVLHITQTLGGGQQRDVHFDYRADGTLERMVYGGHEWFYDQDAAPGWGVVLRRVRHLGNSGGTAALPWEYLYANTGVGPELTTLLAPGRGQLTYTYQTVSRRASSLLQSSRVVTTRASGGYLVQPGTWTFAYNQGANLDTTVVSCPCGTTSYRYNGIGLSGDFVAWKSGTLAERTVYDGPTLLEQELLTYRRSALISSNQVPGESGVWADTAVYNALLEQRQLTRPTQTWTTTLQYNEPNFNDYGQAWRTTETGDAGTRWTDRTFQTGFVPWIANRVVGQSLRVGQETVFSSWTYDLATGFQTQATTLGVTQTSAPTAQGNVASVSDAHGHQTSFTYAWGVVSGTTTPLVTTARTINPDGSVAAETVGNAQTSLTTTYVYDAIGRLLRVRPPGWPAVNEISYEYDHGQDLWLRTARGASQTTQVFDGFGRVVTTTSFTNVKTRVDRDACGRAVFAAAPSTSATETRGVATTYDALGRTKTVTVPGAVVTATYTYANGDVTVTDAASRTTQYNYAGFGGPGERLLSVTDAAGQVTTYTYEVLNNLTDVVGPTASGPARQWRYDGRGLLMEDTQPESGRTQYFYDAAGLLTRTVDSLGRETLLSYDANHRLVLRDATGATADVALTYDPLGRVTSQVMAGGLTTAFTFDAAGRPASRTDSGTPLGQPFGSQYQYDGNDNLTRIIYPSLTQTPRQVSYTYDNENRLTGVLNNGVSFASAFHYDDSGRLDSFQTGPVVHTVTYDTRDRVQALTAGAGSPQLSLTYGYNNVSQVIGITDPRAGMSQAFQYDALDRLRVADGPWGRLEWTYDPQGNRLTEQRAGQTTAYTYHAPTQRLTNTTGGSAESFGYNAVGELTSDGQGTYTYSPAGMMLTAMRPGLSASYQYDADQARVRRDVNGTAQLTVRSVAGQVLSEFEKRGAGPTQWVRDNIYAGSRLLGAVKSTAIASPEVELTAATGSVTEGQAAAITVRLRTPNQQPLAAAVSATVRTTATGTITAQPGADYTPVTQTVTFAANAPHLATATVTIPTIQDASDEPVETIHVELQRAPARCCRPTPLPPM